MREKDFMEKEGQMIYLRLNRKFQEGFSWWRHFVKTEGSEVGA